MKRALAVALIAIVAGLLVGLGSVHAGKPARQAATPLPGLPSYVAGYRSWRRLNRRPITPSSSPHPGIHNVYVSKSPSTKGGIKYPYGSIVVKEGHAPGKALIDLIAIMRKTKGADPKHGDWKWAEYTRSSATEKFSVIGSGPTCWGCHGLVAKRDWVYTKPGS